MRESKILGSKLFRDTKCISLFCNCCFMLIKKHLALKTPKNGLVLTNLSGLFL